jgi:tetratricopeptide (TPR) repeat protein
MNTEENPGATSDVARPRVPADALDRVRTLERQGRLNAAAAGCRNVLQQDPGNVDAWFLLSGVEQRRNASAAALDAVERALASDPANAPALCRRGSILRALGRVEEAAESQRRAIVADPRYAEARNNLGNCLRDLKRPEEAIQQYQHAIALNPDYAQAHHNLGVTLQDLDREVEAIRSLWRAVVLKPDYASAMLNLGTALLRQDKLTEAEGVLRRAVDLKPDDGVAHLQLASALLQMNRSEDAEPSLRRAVGLLPDVVEAEFDLSLLLLAHGRFADGWKHYQSRWRLPENLANPATKQVRRSVPLWAGEPVDGKAILIQIEQGLGDAIQFSRYVPLLVQRGARVTMLCRGLVVRLLAPVAAVAEVLTRVERSRAFDYRAPLMDLPRIFGTELETIPRSDGPYLFAEPERVATWRERIGADGFKIAICWQGTPNTRIDKGRSIPLSAFAPLAALPGVRLISVQKNNGLDQLEHLPAGMRVETLGPDFDAGPDAFLDTAGVMENCDLVITSDTSVAHLAGALARPTWLALSTMADWRWLRHRQDSPWYPSMRLFRQRQAGDWSTVFAEMAESLGGLLAAQGQSQN